MAAATSPEPTPSPPGTLNATDEWDWLANYLGDEIPNLSDHFTVDPNSDGDQNQGNDSTDQCASTTGCTSAFDISSLPMVEDPNLLSDGVGYVTEDLTMLSQGGTTMAQHADQQTSIPNLDAPALSDWLADGSIPDFLESGTYTHQEPQVYHGVALGEGFQSTSDSNIVPPLRVSSTSDNLISQMPVQDTDIHGDFMHFPGHEATSPSPLRLAPAASTSAHTSNLENAMTATTYPEISGLTERPDTQQSVSAENEAKSEKSNLGWVQYDQTSFASNSLAPKPIHSCHLPDNGRKRGRREPLTEAKRKRVAEMRKLKSCLLCRLRKKDV